MTVYAVRNPATGSTVDEYESFSDTHIDSAVDAAAAAFTTWKLTSVDERVALLSRIADGYAERRDYLADIITLEMGKPAAQARAEIDVTESIFRYYATQGPQYIVDEHIDISDGESAFVRREGLGALLGVMPWNFPHYQVARFAAPNLLNGNTIVVKHAPQCPRTALAIEKIIIDASALAGTYVNVFADNGQVERMIADPRIKGVSLTGSERAGTAVAQHAGRHLKKVVLELGGSDAFLVLASADIDTAVKHAVSGRFFNTGQACNAAKRIIVDSSVYDDFLTRFVAAVEKLETGDPTAAHVDIGPMASSGALDLIADQVDDAVIRGARVLCGGRRLPGPGYFFEPTVLIGVDPDMRAYSEELFGPVAAVYRTRTEDEMIALANDSDFGLGAVIHCGDPSRAQALACRLDTGMVAINMPPGSRPELPFGGIKRSGIGRELGKYGLDEFVNRKLVHTARTPRSAV